MTMPRSRPLPGPRKLAGGASGGSGRGARGQVQVEADRRVQVVDVHPLVGVVEPRHVDLERGGEERGEAVRRRAPGRPEVRRVGEAGAEARQQRGAGDLRGDPLVDRPDDRSVGRRGVAGDERFGPGQLVRRHAPSVLPKTSTDRGLDVGLGGARQDPAVELHPRPAGLGVALVGAAEHRRRHGGPGERGHQVLQLGVEGAGGSEGRGQVVAGGVGVAEQHLQHPVDEGVRDRGGEPAADARDQLAQVGDRVVTQRRHAAVAGLAHGGDPGGVRALLADPDADEGAAVGELEPLAAALVDAHVRPDVGTGTQQPVHPDLRHAVLLVGDGQEPQVPARPPARADQLLEGDRARGHLALHVQRAAAPQVAVVGEYALERRVGPVPDVDRHHVRVADERQAGRRTALAPGHPGHQVRPVLVAFAGHQLALDPGVAEVLDEVLGDQRLVAGVHAERVAGVQADQVTGELDDLGVQRIHGRDAIRGGAARWSRRLRSNRHETR